MRAARARVLVRSTHVVRTPTVRKKVLHDGRAPYPSKRVHGYQTRVHPEYIRFSQGNLVFNLKDLIINIILLKKLYKITILEINHYFVLNRSF